jgi:hypothetical protein
MKTQITTQSKFTALLTVLGLMAVGAIAAPVYAADASDVLTPKVS